MTIITWDDWREWLDQGHTMMPYIQKYPKAASSIESWQSVWREASPYAFALESGKEGRYHFMGMHPRSVIKGKGDEAVITDFGSNRVSTAKGSPLTLVKQWLQPYRAPKVKGVPKFTGGIVGYWAYDAVRMMERIPEKAKDDAGLPDYYFMMMDELWIVDALTGDLYCCVHVPVHHQPDLAHQNDVEAWKLKFQEAKARARAMKEVWDGCMTDSIAVQQARQRSRAYASISSQALQDIEIEKVEGIHIDFPKSAFADAVKQIQEYIRAGDVFQVNISTRQRRLLKASGEEIYEWLRLCNPSPYMAYVRFPELQLVSASPELLVRLEGSKLSTRPIGGTRRRGSTKAEDDELADELIYNDKERAEHIMLVDLERNDMGRICAFGSVRVKEFMVLEYYSHVMHIVSEIEGLLAENKDIFDVIEAVFPGGTITGAPKIRTMEIIEQLEPVRRGPYTGSLGWIDYNGDAEFNIMIRTLVIDEKGQGYVQAGAGIVIDSDPEKEYAESLNKAKALWQAVQYSERWKGEHLL